MAITMANDPRTALMLQMLQGQAQQPRMRRGEGPMNAADKLAQAFMMKNMLNDFEGRKSSAAEERANAVGLAMGRPAETQTYDNGQTINWNEQKPNPALAAQSLGPDNADLQEKLMSRMLGIGGNDTPSAIQEYEYFNKLPPEARQIYLQSKRQTLSPGMFISPEGNAAEIPGYSNLRSSFKGAEEAAKVSGKELGEKEGSLRTNIAKLPQLEETVKKLSELGKKATYTISGQGVDIVNRELGLEPREEAIARAEYIALVDNQVLPLLRDTFGAQFTQKEGESLKVTLGDPNKSPEEKDAVLRSFIQQKKANIKSLQREVGPPSQGQLMDAIRKTPAGADLPDDLKALGADVLGRGQEGVTKSGIKYKVIE